MEIKYTLDKLVMDIKLNRSVVEEIFNKLGSGYGYSSVITLKHWSSSKMSSFRENLTIDFEDKNSFYIGVTPNWEKPNNYSTVVRLEFNPAKVRDNVVFQAIHHDFICDARFIEFKRFDVAIDIPVDRRDIWLRKDRRTYKLYQNSDSDKTEYLGQRSEHGQVKLYNKQKESKLDHVLTRLEITMDYEKCSWDELKRVWPDVTYTDTGQLEIDDLTMDGTDRVLLMACMEHGEYLKMLGRKMGKKIECILSRYTQKLKPDSKNYNIILSDILTFGKSIYYGDLPEYLRIKNMWG